MLYKKLDVNNQVHVIESENKISRLKVSWFSCLRPEMKVGNALNGHLMIPSIVKNYYCGFLPSINLVNCIQSAVLVLL